MRSSDSEKKRRYEVGVEATSAEDAKPSDSNSNKRSTRRPAGGSLEVTAKRHTEPPGVTSTKQLIDLDEDELIFLSSQSRTPQSHASTRQESSTRSFADFRRIGGYVRDALPNDYLRDALQRYGVLPTNTSEEASHKRVQRDSEGQSKPLSSPSSSPPHGKDDSGGLTTNVDAVMEHHQRELARLSAQSKEKEAYYQDKISRLENASNGLESRLKEMELHYKSTISSLGAQGSRLAVEWTQKETHYHNKISSLEAQNSQSERKAMALQRQFDAACADFSRELTEARSKNQFEQVEAADTEIQGSWKMLGFSVRQFVQAHCPTSFSSATLKDLRIMSRLPNLNHYCNNPELVLQSPLFAQSLIEACVWAYLYDAIFRPEAEYWAGKVGKNFMATCAGIQRESHTVCCSLYIHAILTFPLDLMRSEKQDESSLLSAFHHWRSDSMHHLQKFGVIRPPENGLLATMMISYLAPIMNQDVHDVARSTPTKDAIDIIAAATSIDKIFRMSKAHYTVVLFSSYPPYRPPFFGFPFDELFMEEKSEFAGFMDRSERPVPVVDLTLSPAILKTGNIEGNNYHSEQFLMKLEVVCGLQKFLDTAKKMEAKIASSPGSNVPAVGSHTHHKSNSSSSGQKRASSGSGGSSDVDMLGSPNKVKEREDN